MRPAAFLKLFIGLSAIGSTIGCGGEGSKDLSASESGIRFPPTDVSPIRIYVEGFEPQVPIEGEPMFVTFSICNGNGIVAQPTRSGFVGLSMKPVNAAPRDSSLEQDWYFSDLADHTCQKGVIKVNAPAVAAKANGVQLYYYEKVDQGGGEFPVKSHGPTLAQSALQAFDTAFRYYYDVDNLKVWKQRNKTGSHDHVYGSCSGDTSSGQDTPCVSADDRPMTDAAGVKEIGLVMPGDTAHDLYGVGMKAGPFRVVPGSEGSIRLAYSFVTVGDSAADTVQKVLNGISAATAGVLSIIYPQAATAWQHLDEFTRWLNSQLQGCDGALAYDVFDLTNDQVEAMTYSGPYVETKQFGRHNAPGSPLNSPTDCGDSPWYDINWGIRRSAWGDHAEIRTDLPEVTPPIARLKKGSTVKFALNNGNWNESVVPRWTVTGGPSSEQVGYFVDNHDGTYSFTLTYDLPADTLLRVEAMMADGRTHKVGYIGRSAFHLDLTTPRF